MFDCLSFVLILFNILLLFWFIIYAKIWLINHEGKLSCHFVPPILLLISLASCLVSIYVYNNFLFSPC